jgi:uncharacterized protein YbcV (DUF1398 family)
MDNRKKTLAETCLRGAETNSMAFPQIVRALMEAGFESYAIDFRRSTAIYYSPDGDSIEFSTHTIETAIASNFDSRGIQLAIRDAQQQVPGYTYQSFCNKVAAAGCAGYFVSFSGRRALYVGRTGETHVEHFPN